MKLVDMMKDENLGLALLYNFTKGYGHVPMKVYDIVLPLLYNDDFRENLTNHLDVAKAIYHCKDLDEEFYNHFVESMEQKKEMTSKALGICLLNRYLDFEIENGEMVGIQQKSSIVDLNEAIELGKYFQGKSVEEILNELKQNIHHIVFLDSSSLGEDIDLSLLKRYGKVVTHPQTAQHEIVERAKDATILLTNKCIIDEDVLQQLPKLELICITATGTNNVDLNYCHEHNIPVCNVSGYSSKSVAQHTFALALTLIEKMPYYHQYVSSKEYTQSSMFCHLGEKFFELSGKTWGIVGLGAIGQEVAKIASVFGCKVIYYSTSGRNNDQPYQRVGLDELLKESDIISIHAPMNENTYHLFDREVISKMKETAILINVGRGGIIDEDALYEALKEHRLQGAALDVFEVEPMKEDSPLLDINDSNRLIMTPHVAWATVEARQRLFDLVCLNIEGFLNKDLKNVC